MYYHHDGIKGYGVRGRYIGLQVLVIIDRLLGEHRIEETNQCSSLSSQRILNAILRSLHVF